MWIIVLNEFINGFITGIGLNVAMLVFGLLMFKFFKKFIIKIASDIWENVRGHVDVTGSIDFPEQHKDWEANDTKNRNTTTKRSK